MALKAPASVTRDGDYAEWTREQAEILRARHWDALDLEALIDELEIMSNSELNSVQRALSRAIEHLLKLEHSPASEPRRGWRLSVANHRQQAHDTLAGSPSVRGKIDIARAYGGGRRLAAMSFREYGDADPGALPEDCPYTLEQLLDFDWWPANRHGLPAGPGEG
jgi:hypothetical protein